MMEIKTRKTTQEEKNNDFLLLLLHGRKNKVTSINTHRIQPKDEKNA